MKTLALCLILAAAAFAQKPVTPPAQPAPAAPASAPQQQFNPCAAQVSLNVLEAMTDVVELRKQVIYSRACMANGEASRVLGDLYQALNDVQAKPAEPKKEGTK